MRILFLKKLYRRQKHAEGPERPTHLLTLSAKHKNALKKLAQRYGTYLKTHQDVSLADVCFTANTGRTHLNHRVALIAESSEKMCERLNNVGTGKRAAGVFEAEIRGNRVSRMAFLFTGQGSQYTGMGRQLYETQAMFRNILDQCDEILRPFLEVPLLAVLYPSNTQTLLHQTVYTQPAIFVLEYALAHLWMSWGITPSIVMGHSIGEYAAACIAGVFSLEDALKLIAIRGRIMQSLPQNGTMIAVFTNEARLSEIIAPYADTVSIAAINSPNIIVISGETGRVNAIVSQLAAQGISTKPLQVSHAFHSPLMDPILEEFQQVAADVNFSAPTIPLISDVSGTVATEEVTEADYWARHIRQPVRFVDGIATLMDQGVNIFLEIGANPILTGLGRQIADNRKTKGTNEAEVLWLHSLRQKKSDWQQMFEGLAQLYMQGVPIDWAGVDAGYPHHKIPLPTYPFQRKRHWIDEAEAEPREGMLNVQPQTSLVKLLTQGELEPLVELLERSGKFSKEQRGLLPDILNELSGCHRQELAAATLKDWFYQIEWQSLPPVNPQALWQLRQHPKPGYGSSLPINMESAQNFKKNCSPFSKAAS